MKFLVLISAVVCLAGLLDDAQGYDANAASIADCLPLACSSSWESWGAKQKLPCSVASGHFPADVIPVQLPMIYEGNYDLCETFENAHYCKLEVKFPPGIPLPILGPHFKPTNKVFPLGPFRLDQCVSKACDMAKLKLSMDNQVEKIIFRLSKQFPTLFDHHEADVVELFKKTLTVSCTEDFPQSLDAVGVFTIVVFTLFTTVALLSTVVAVHFPKVSASQKVVRWFSMNHNTERLFAAIPGDFNVLNGIRFLSMCWVIMGHCILSYAMTTKNMSAEAKVLQSFGFTFVRGAEYAVDTFFFMSGFLACWGLLQQFVKVSLSVKSYFLILLGRYVRLTPTYLLVVLYYWKVFPSTGAGPNWDNVVTSSKVCDSTWGYNFLYVNNLFPWNHAGAMESCAGWTWYLANDFQFFLVVPLLAQLYIIGRRQPTKMQRTLLKYAPTVLLILVQLVVTISVLNDLGPVPSGDPRFQDRVYTKPWCRMTPYMVGILLALWHFDRTQVKPEDESQYALLEGEGADRLNNKSWKKLSLPTAAVRSVMAAAVAGMFAVVIALYWQWRCENSEHECNVFFAQFLYGFFISPNWGKAGVVFYFSFCYLMWSVALAAFCYLLICDDEYDLFRVKWLLQHPLFTPFARLTYNAYLVHLPIMGFVYGRARYAMEWNSSRIALEVVGFIFLAYTLSFCLYLTVEKPIMNMTSLLFQSVKGSANRTQDETDAEDGEHRRLPLDRQFSCVSDIDNESIHLASPLHGSHTAQVSPDRNEAQS